MPMISLCRSPLRQEGIRVPSGSAVTFAKRVRELELPDDLRDAAELLPKAHEQVCGQIDAVDKNVAHAVKRDERVQRLTTVPSVGPVTAATFIAPVDDIARFDSKAKLSSYLGLVPREYGSGADLRGA
jgi:transposase